MGQSAGSQTAGVEPIVLAKPESTEGVPPQGKLGPIVELRLRGLDEKIPERLVTAVALATFAGFREVSQYVGHAPGWHSQLLSRQGSIRGRGSDQRQYQDPHQKRARLQKSPLPVTQSTAHSRYQDRIYRSPEGCVKMGLPSDSCSEPH